jgi:tetratricopeptide (TPR) repeat protein
LQVFRISSFYWNQGCLNETEILDRPTEAQTDIQKAIVLAQAKQTQEPTDWQNNFNLALYYLAAGRFEESDGLYDRAAEASTDLIEMAIRDLDDYLMLFPDRSQAREVRDHLSALV